MRLHISQGEGGQATKSILDSAKNRSRRARARRAGKSGTAPRGGGRSSLGGRNEERRMHVLHLPSRMRDTLEFHPDYVLLTKLSSAKLIPLGAPDYSALPGVIKHSPRGIIFSLGRLNVHGF